MVVFLIVGIGSAPLNEFRTELARLRPSLQTFHWHELRRQLLLGMLRSDRQPDHYMTHKLVNRHFRRWLLERRRKRLHTVVLMDDEVAIPRRHASSLFVVGYVAVPYNPATVLANYKRTAFDIIAELRQNSAAILQTTAQLTSRDYMRALTSIRSVAGNPHFLNMPFRASAVTDAIVHLSETSKRHVVFGTASEVASAVVSALRSPSNWRPVHTYQQLQLIFDGVAD